jgi:hypothetical protein
MSTEFCMRVTAEIYRGIDFPADWVTRASDISVAMTRELLLTVTVLFDVGQQPVAVLWQPVDGEERYALPRFEGSADEGLLDDLASDLTALSRRVGANDDVLATLLWEPSLLRREQGLSIRKQAIFNGKYSSGPLEWTMPTREIIVAADRLVMMVRQIDDQKRGIVPATAEELRASVVLDGAQTFLILPARAGETSAAPVAASNVSATLVFAAACLILIALGSVYLAGDLF